MKSIKSKLEIVAKKIQASIFVSTTQLLETWNQSNQSLKWLPKKFKLQFLFQQHNYYKHEINQIKAWNGCQKNSSFNFCFNNTTTTNMKSIKSKLEIVAKKIQASIFVSTTQLLETWNQSNQSLKSLPKISSFNFCFNNTTTTNMKSIKSKLEIVAKNSSFNFCFNSNTTRNKSIKWTPMPIEK